MVIPGVTMRKVRVKRELVGWRTAFTVCQAISMAITIVLPAPVANLSATRSSPGFASSFARAKCSRTSFARRDAGATSVSQIIVSAASTWQKNGRRPYRDGFCQCSSSISDSGVRPRDPGCRRRQRATSSRTPLMITARSAYDCSIVESPSAPKSSFACRPPCRPPFPPRRGFGTGLTKSALRRLSTTRPVGWPSWSSCQCSRGNSYGVLRIGFSKKFRDIGGKRRRRRAQPGPRPAGGEWYRPRRAADPSGASAGAIGRVSGRR